MSYEPTDTATEPGRVANRPGVDPVAMAGFFIWDLLVVGSFVLLGRDTHRESLDLTRSLQTATPFLIALGAAWLPPQVRSRPEAIRSGVVIGTVTPLLGLLLRSLVFGEGLSGAFPIIATGYLAGLIVLGRVLWTRLGRTRPTREVPD